MTALPGAPVLPGPWVDPQSPQAAAGTGTDSPRVSFEGERDRIGAAWAVLATVPDPEVPAISLRDLGIVRDVRLDDDGVLDVVLTPTYSGCPATEVIDRSVLEAIDAAGLGPVRTSLRRHPAWTTDWISEDGRRKLRDYGIAPPGPVDPSAGVPIRLIGRRAAAPVPCPRCESTQTEQLSAFGATACKALYRCLACREPFEHFKPI
jgi:ring-1,2-phenylacetyl-CoA epoxidase subunit PaaD